MEKIANHVLHYDKYHTYIDTELPIFYRYVGRPCNPHGKPEHFENGVIIEVLDRVGIKKKGSSKLHYYFIVRGYDTLVNVSCVNKLTVYEIKLILRKRRIEKLLRDK